MSVRLRKVLGDERPQSGLARRYQPAVMRPEALTDRRHGALSRTVRLRCGEETQAETGLAFHRAGLRRGPIAAAYAFVGLFAEQHDKAGAPVPCAVERAFLDCSWAGSKAHSHATPPHALWAGIPGAGLHGLQSWFASIFVVAPWGVIITRAIFIRRHIVVRMVAQH